MVLDHRLASMFFQFNQRYLRRMQGCLYGQGKIKRSALIYFSLGPHFAAMAIDDALHQCEAYACAGELSVFVQPLKRAKELVGIAGIETGAVVFYHERDLISTFVGADLDDRMLLF